MKAYYYSVIAFMAIFSLGLSKKIEGSIDDAGLRWTFLTRFCFLSEKGELSYDISYPQDYGIQRLLFYYDTPGQWEAAYRSGKTCEEKVNIMNNQNIFPLDARVCRTETRNGRQWYRCRNDMGFRSSRERWWYLVVERCGAPRSSSVSGLYLDYYIHMTNGDDLLHKEFSADQFYILPTDIVFFIIYVILLSASIVVAVILRKRHMLHTTYKMYMASLIIWTVALFFLVIAWGSYGNTGWEKDSMEVFGRILQTASTIIFTLQLVLMAKGYTIVRGRLTNKATLKIVIFITLYSIGTITLYAWEAYIFDEGKVLYYYESPPGYCMIGLQLLGWLWMTKAAVFTLKHYSNSASRFYIPFYIIYTIWFWTGPIITMLAMFTMAKWTREKTVHGVQQLVGFLGHLVFFILTLPAKVNRNFPYNIKTTQIGDASQGGDSNTASMYAIDSHPVVYEGTGPNLNIFVTSNHQPEADTSFDGRMYKPLDPGAFTNSNTPPPTYSEATVSSPLPPIGGQSSDKDQDSSDHLTSGMSNEQLPPNGHLPPLENRRTSEIRLPPIRASGLPPIVPNAPPDENDKDLIPPPQPPPNYTELFQVDKK